MWPISARTPQFPARILLGVLGRHSVLLIGMSALAFAADLVVAARQVSYGSKCDLAGRVAPGAKRPLGLIRMSQERPKTTSRLLRSQRQALAYQLVRCIGRPTFIHRG